MILKSLSRKSNGTQLLKYVVRYSMKDKENKQDKEEATIILRHNIRSRKIENIIEEFKTNEAFRLYKRKDSVLIYHDIISFAPQNQKAVTTDILKAFAKKYTAVRAPNTLAVVVAHRGKTSHTHLHAVVAGVTLNGLSSRISKAKFKNVKLELERFQEQYPQLAQSAIEHIKPVQQAQTKSVERFKQSRQTNKETMYTILEEAYTKALSEDDFLHQLKAKQYEPYYRNSKLQGVISQGQKYRFSRIGFDTEKLQNFDDRQIQPTDPLQEIRMLRKNKNQELVPETEVKKHPAEKEQQQTREKETIIEIANLRRRSVQREFTGHSLELTE
jgi:hypothetical protein